MEITLAGDIEEILEGAFLLQDELLISLGEKGKIINVKKHSCGLSVVVENGESEIRFNKICEFYRAFAIAIDAIKNNRNLEISETPKFDTVGPMLDMSRNAVYTVSSIKKFIKKFALMGLNMIMLYTEDTYEIQGEPYFGYMRGSYSKSEMIECVEYAEKLGIQMIPCIQTLGHLEQMLKWKCYDDIKDMPNLLLSNEDKTYMFIEKMIKTVKEIFKTNIIHIGMDEAVGLGEGAYKKLFGEETTFNIMIKHLDRVVDIAKKYGLNPLIWSDMFISPASKTHNYWDIENEIPKDVILNKNSNASLVFWCYHIVKKDEYKKLIQIHKQYNGELWFAGSMETCFGIVPRYCQSLPATEASLLACKEENIRNIICTSWGDDGSEVDYFGGLLGYQIFAEHCYNSVVKQDKLSQMFYICTGLNAADFLNLKYFDDVPKKDGWDTDLSNPSRYIFWQDILLGIFDAHLVNVDLKTHYNNLAEELKYATKRNGEYNMHFELYYEMARFLSLKCDIGIRLRELYKNDCKDLLLKITTDDLAELINRAKRIKELRGEQWFANCKPFGWEVLEYRYSGLISRIETAKKRINLFICGEISKIEELEIEILPFNHFDLNHGRNYGRCNNHKHMISAGVV